MIIRGNTVTVGNPRADYSQTDSTRADYILNKPEAAIAKAQETADGAVKTAEAALPKAGGTMTGSINMGGKAITNLPDPTADTDAATKGYLESYVDGKRFSATLTLPADRWSTAVPYTQTVAVSGLLATDQPHIFPVYSDTLATAMAQKEAWAMVSDADTAEGSITFKCFEDNPTVDIPIQLEVNR